MALASFPGSGNTWLRYLIQQSTGKPLKQAFSTSLLLFETIILGILTGSVFHDEDLLKNGFPAESITNGSVIAIKTHKFSDAAISKFDRAILLVRDPFACLPAEFNRKFAGHTGHASAGHYHRNGGWRSFVKQRAAKWRKMNLAWLEAYNDKPEGLIVIAYEDLTLNLEKELSKVLNFLGVKVPEGSMRCVIEHKEGVYKRAKQQALNFTIFDQELTRVITVEKDIVYRKLGLLRPPVPPYLVASN